LLAGIY